MQPGSGKLRFLLAATFLPAQPPPLFPPPLPAKLLKTQGNFRKRFSSRCCSRGQPGSCTPGQPRRETCPTFPPAVTPACGANFHLPPRRDLKRQPAKAHGCLAARLPRGKPSQNTHAHKTLLWLSAARPAPLLPSSSPHGRLFPSERDPEKSLSAAPAPALEKLQKPPGSPRSPTLLAALPPPKLSRAPSPARWRPPAHPGERLGADSDSPGPHPLTMIRVWFLCSAAAGSASCCCLL